MADKDVYACALKLDNQGRMELFGEAGEMDRPEDPVSYMLVGLISCLALTAKSILDKMQVGYEKVVVDGKVYMADDKIRYGDRIECKMSLEGGPDFDDGQKARLAQLTKKYCTVSRTIENRPEITLAME